MKKKLQRTVGMNKKLKKMLSVCIFGNSGSLELKHCIERIGELTDRIILIDTNSTKDAQAKAAELGVLWADLKTLASVVESEWILCIKPNELVKILSLKKLSSQLNSSQKSYRVYVKDKTIGTMLEEYQFIGNLGQFDKIGDLAFATRLEVRLARQDDVEVCLKALIENRPKLPFDAEEVIESLRIETVHCCPVNFFEKQVNYMNLN